MKCAAGRFASSATQLTLSQRVRNKTSRAIEQSTPGLSQEPLCHRRRRCSPPHSACPACRGSSSLFDDQHKLAIGADRALIIFGGPGLPSWPPMARDSTSRATVYCASCAALVHGDRTQQALHLPIACVLAGRVSGNRGLVTEGRLGPCTGGQQARRQLSTARESSLSQVNGSASSRTVSRWSA